MILPAALPPHAAPQCGIVPAARMAILADSLMRAPSPSAPQDCMNEFST
jgi:hypothetical protein